MSKQKPFDVRIMRGLIMSEVTFEKSTRHWASFDQLIFKSTCGRTFRLGTDDCSAPELIDIVGDLQDLVGHPLLQAESVQSKAKLSNRYKFSRKKADTHTKSMWTYYKFATIKGHVHLRWLGESDYYSVEVDFVELVGLQAAHDHEEVAHLRAKLEQKQAEEKPGKPILSMCEKLAFFGYSELNACLTVAPGSSCMVVNDKSGSTYTGGGDYFHTAVVMALIEYGFADQISSLSKPCALSELLRDHVMPLQTLGISQVQLEINPHLNPNHILTLPEYLATIDPPITEQESSDIQDDNCLFKFTLQSVWKEHHGKSFYARSAQLVSHKAADYIRASTSH